MRSSVKSSNEVFRTKCVFARIGKKSLDSAVSFLKTLYFWKFYQIPSSGHIANVEQKATGESGVMDLAQHFRWQHAPSFAAELIAIFCSKTKMDVVCQL